MGNSLRCCLSCVLPCGALDVVRVVHLNGHVEEYSRQVSAGEVMAANPNHIISKPCSLQGDVSQKVLIVSPESDLKRGDIYFLIPEQPAAAVNEKKEKRRHRKKETIRSSYSFVKDVEQENYLKEVLSEKAVATAGGGRHHRRRSSACRVAVWRPRLESISED